MPAADSLSTRIRVSDPKPAFCSGCHQAAQESVTFIDFDAAHDGGVFINDQGAVLTGADDLHLCEHCVRGATEALGTKPELHQRQLREIRKLELEAEHWRDYARKLERTLEERPEPQGTARRSNRKAA